MSPLYSLGRSGSFGIRTDIQQTTAGKADRPALKEDNLAEKNSGIPNSKL